MSLLDSIEKIKKLNQVRRKKHRKKRMKKRLFQERNILNEVTKSLDSLKPVRYVNFIFIHKYIFKEGKIFKEYSIHKLPVYDW